MRITVRFMDGAVEEFDTNALTTDSALGHTNALTDLRVTLGNGLWVEASWYRVPQANEDAGEAPLARRTLGCRLRVLTGGKVEAVRSIGLDGRLQWMRIGPDLCDMAALDEMVDLLHDPEEPSSCIAGRVVWLHDLLRERMPGAAGQPDCEKRVCAALGMTPNSYEFVSTASASVYIEEDYEQERVRWAWPSV